MLLALTWCHRTPAYTPTAICVEVIGAEFDVDYAAPTDYLGRQRGRYTLASCYNGARISALCGYPPN